MANPQLENGYLRLSNELAEALARTRLNGAQFRIVLTVARECYGRNGGQKLAQISARKLSTMTDLHIRSVRRELSRLLSTGILARSGDPTHHLYGIHKDYKKWDLKSWGGADQSVTPDKSVTPDQSVLKSGPICPPRGPRPINREERRTSTATKQQCDPRFRPLVGHYKKRSKEKNPKVKPRFDPADGKALKRLLKDQPEASVEEIIRWLDNAFNSTALFPLRITFRMTQFQKHYPDYVNGPLHRRNGAGGNGNRPVQIPERKKLTKEDEAVYEQYRGGSE